MASPNDRRHMSISDDHQLALVKEPAQGGKLTQPLLPPRGLPRGLLAQGLEPELQVLQVRLAAEAGSMQKAWIALLLLPPPPVCTSPAAMQTWLGRMYYARILNSKLNHTRYHTWDAKTDRELYSIVFDNKSKMLTQLHFSNSRR